LSISTPDRRTDGRTTASDRADRRGDDQEPPVGEVEEPGRLAAGRLVKHLVDERHRAPVPSHRWRRGTAEQRQRVARPVGDDENIQVRLEREGRARKPRHRRFVATADRVGHPLDVRREVDRLDQVELPIANIRTHVEGGSGQILAERGFGAGRQIADDQKEPACPDEQQQRQERNEHLPEEREIPEPKHSGAAPRGGAVAGPIVRHARHRSAGCS
jgi:hypothetical protein